MALETTAEGRYSDELLKKDIAALGRPWTLLCHRPLIGATKVQKELETCPSYVLSMAGDGTQEKQEGHGVLLLSGCKWDISGGITTAEFMYACN